MIRWLAAAWGCALLFLTTVFAVGLLVILLAAHAVETYPSPRQIETIIPSPSGGVGPEVQFTGTAADVTYSGTIAYADESYGPLYLALPEPRGTWARICGPADCVTRQSTDFGPDQRVHPDRIADVSSVDFVTICGVPTTAGLCPGSVTISNRPRATLPPTDR